MSKLLSKLTYGIEKFKNELVHGIYLLTSFIILLSIYLNKFYDVNSLSILVLSIIMATRLNILSKGKYLYPYIFIMFCLFLCKLYFELALSDLYNDKIYYFLMYSYSLFIVIALHAYSFYISNEDKFKSISTLGDSIIFKLGCFVLSVTIFLVIKWGIDLAFIQDLSKLGIANFTDFSNFKRFYYSLWGSFFLYASCIIIALITLLFDSIYIMNNISNKVSKFITPCFRIIILVFTIPIYKNLSNIDFLDKAMASLEFQDNIFCKENLNVKVDDKIKFIDKKYIIIATPVLDEKGETIKYKFNSKPIMCDFKQDYNICG